MSSKGGVEQWPGLSAALAGFLPLRPDMRHLVPGAEGLIYTPTTTYKYSYINQKSFALAVIFAISVSLTAIMWLTSAYDNAILKLVSIRDDIDTVFENWRSPPTKSRLLVHIFNYTNPEAIMEGKIPRVQEVGPFVFSEKMERTNVKFHDNGTVSFQEMRHIKPLLHLSNGSFNDTLWVPNIAYLTLLFSASSGDFGIQTIMSGVFHAVQARVLSNFTVEEFIWGMNDGLFKFVKQIKSILGDEVKPFGFLAKRRGVHHDVITMHTGNRDLNLVGLITKVNGESLAGKWGNTTCDILESSDGSIFPAPRAYRKEPLYVYAPTMCRRLPLYFNKTTVSKDGFPVHQYNLSPDVFNYSKNEEYKCFSMNNELPKNGIFNTAPCQTGAPIFASFPHFWQGDPSLREDVLGLYPNQEKHQSYFHIHERLGVSLLVKTRFQLNVMLRKPNYVASLSRMKEEMILPVAWLELDSGELNEEFVNVLYHLTYTVRVVQEVLKWSLLILSLGSIIMFSLEIKRCIKK